MDTSRTLIVMSGLAGTGKSTIASAIGRIRRIPVLSVDPIESAVVASGIPRSFETGLAAYLVAVEVAKAQLTGGLDVVIDAANYVEPGRAMWRDLAARQDARLKVIVCIVSDPAIHLQRLAQRNRGLRIAEPTLVDVERQRAEWTEWLDPHLVLDAIAPADENIAQAMRYTSATGADGDE